MQNYVHLHVLDRIICSNVLIFLLYKIMVLFVGINECIVKCIIYVVNHCYFGLILRYLVYEICGYCYCCYYCYCYHVINLFVFSLMVSLHCVILMLFHILNLSIFLIYVIDINILNLVR